MSPKTLLTYLLAGLIQQRDANSNLKLAKPVHLPIRTIIAHLERHFNADYSNSGASRLPVLAVYGAYQQMVKEVNRYKKHDLKKLEAHTSPDRRSGATGDIEVKGDNKKIFEAVEIKHQITITPSW